mmetsp:Transcript_108487/g.291671  ORF Transcript_108487/g.291671 Transcript_108487/m.291671 type:complete len:268 (-) Transcript_108487:389-1192(-)
MANPYMIAAATAAAVRRRQQFEEQRQQQLRMSRARNSGSAAEQRSYGYVVEPRSYSPQRPPRERKRHSAPATSLKPRNDIVITLALSPLIGGSYEVIGTNMGGNEVLRTSLADASSGPTLGALRALAERGIDRETCRAQLVTEEGELLAPARDRSRISEVLALPLGAPASISTVASTASSAAEALPLESSPPAAAAGVGTGAGTGAEVAAAAAPAEGGAPPLAEQVHLKGQRCRNLEVPAAKADGTTVVEEDLARDPDGCSWACRMQ